MNAIAFLRLRVDLGLFNARYHRWGWYANGFKTFPGWELCRTIDPGGRWTTKDTMLLELFAVYRVANGASHLLPFAYFNEIL